VKTLLTLLFIFIFIHHLNAQTESEADTVISNKLDFFAYPYAFYTPETELAFGVGGMVYFWTIISKTVRPSKILLSGYYTTNAQYFIKLAPVIYFPGTDQDLLDIKITYGKEILKFYGFGNDSPEIDNPDYQLRSLRFYTEFGGTGFLLEDLHTGLIFDYSINKDLDKRSNPYLTDSLVTGSEGGNISGLGLLLLFDNRDNVFYPTQNSYYKFRAQFFGKYLGGDFNFNRITADLRNYFSFGDSHVIATQLYGDFTNGSVPFFRMPALGGSERMRGYFSGRYRDEVYITAQVEYRKILWWRLGVAAFLGTGDVIPKIRDLHLKNLKFSYGFGLRFVFDEAEKINIRVDAGFGKNTSGIYFALEEAF